MPKKSCIDSVNMVVNFKESTMKSKINFAALSVLILSFLFTPLALAEKADNGVAVLRQTGKAFTEVAKKAIPAVVSIKVEKNVVNGGQYNRRSPFEDDLFEHFFGPRFRQPSPRERKQVGQGSGFIISEDGYILSNNHVVGEADKITVTLNDSRVFEAELLGTDPATDVAIIKIDGESLPYVELGESEDLEIGEWAIAVGNPFGLNATVTVGVVSAKGRTALGITGQDGQPGYEDFIQTDAAINPGNSGGPLLNIDGKAIGINTAIFSQSGGYMGIGFAIPMDMAKNVKNQLIKYGKVERGFIGIFMDQNDITPDLAKLFGLEDNYGVIITGVIEGSPAEKAGLKADDVIIELNGEKVRNFLTFRNSIAMLEPGTKVTLTIFRDGKEKEVNLRVGSQDEGQALLNESSNFAKEFGITVEDVTSEMAKKYGYTVGRGVVISDVVKGSSADRQGLSEGMLILSVSRVDVGSVLEFNKVFSELKKRDAESVWLRVKFGSMSRYVELRR